MVQYIKRQLRSPFENNEATCAAHKTWNELKFCWFVLGMHI